MKPRLHETPETVRSRVLPIVAALVLSLSVVAGAVPPSAAADEIYLSEEEAPQAVFHAAEHFERYELRSTPELRERIRRRLGRLEVSSWETSYPVFIAFRGGETIGTAVIVEEIGKHRNITFIVGVASDGSIAGVAVMVYREAYGGEVRSGRFLAQYRGKDANEPLLPGRDIRNITGSTLSVYAIGRGVKKAAAVVDGLALEAGAAPAGENDG